MTHDFSRIDAVIAELLDLARSGGLPAGDFREPMHAMGAEGGRFVESIVRATRPRQGLEIGTSSGFSALCAIRGALATGGGFKLVTVDYDPAKAKWARENFQRARVSEYITILVGDGLGTSQQLAGPWDYVLLDAAKSQNLPLLMDLQPKLNAGAVVLTDNALTHAEELREFTAYVRRHSDLASGMFEVGNGIEMTLKLSPRQTGTVST